MVEGNGRAVLLLLLVLLSGVGRAQSTFETKQSFVAGLIRFMEALAGTFGDEGPRLLAGIEAMRTGLERWDAALEAYEIAETLELQHARAAEAAAARRLLGGAVYLERGRLDRAVQQFTAAAELDPGRAGVHLFRGLAYEAARKPIEAADAFRQAWTIDPNDPVHAYLLIRHTSPGRSEDAQRALKVLQAFQQQRQAKQDFRAASPFLHVALVDELPSTEPTFPPARYADGFALVREGKYEDAIARFREAAATDPLNSSATPASNRVKDGIAALRDGDIMLALGHLTMAIEAAPDSSETHRILGMTYWFDQQYEESVHQLETAIRLNPSDERSRLALADVLTEAGQLMKAELALRDAIKALPASGEARWRLGRLYRRLNRDPEALGLFEYASRLGPIAGVSGMYATIGRLHLNAADLDRATQAFSQRVATDPNAADAHRDLGEAYRKQDRHDDGLAELLAALLIDPRDADAYASIGQIHLGAGRYDDAVGALRQAVALKPGHPGARYALASALLRSGTTEEGREELQQFQRLQAAALEQAQRAYEVNQLKLEAELRVNQGRYEEASRLWQQVVEREPAVVGTVVKAAHALAQAGRHDAAIEILLTALTLNAGLEVHRDLADLYAKVGKMKESEAARATYRHLKEERLRALGNAR